MMKTTLLLTLLLVSTITFGQNVGINESNPTGRLHITTNSTLTTPQLKLTEIGNDYTRLKFNNNLHPTSYWDLAAFADTTITNSRLNFYFKNNTNAGDRLTIMGNGNIGINNTNPSGRLHITSNSTLTIPQLKMTEIGNDYTRVKFDNSAHPDAYWDLAAHSDTITNNARLNFYFKNNTNAGDRLTIMGNGNIGINHTNPTGKLHIRSNSTQNLLNIESNYIGNFQITGVDCSVNPSDGYGVGANFNGGHRGLRGLADGKGSGGTSIGVVGSGWGSNNAGTRIGIHGAAWGGNVNWAGYFKDGNVYVTNELRIGSGAINGATGYKVAVDGKVIAEELRINLSSAWPDYVFDQSYDLMSIEELSESIEHNHHLPGIPTAKSIQQDGLIVGDMQKKMMEKIEELTLYIIQLNDELTSVQNELQELKTRK